MALTTTEKASVRRALTQHDPSALQSAAELHQFVHHYNWDDGVVVLEGVVDHPKCDLGTALLLYWSTEPAYAHERYASLDEATAAKDINLPAMRLAERVAQKVAAGGFAQGTVRFVPPAVPPTKRPFAACVLQPSEGEDHPRQSLDDISVEPLGAEDTAALTRRLGAGFSALKKLGVTVGADADPTAIVNALTGLSRTLPDLRPAPQKAVLVNLGFVFGHQLHRAFDADWRVRVANKARDPMIFSRDRAVSLNPSRTLGALSDRAMHRHFSLDGLFQAFGKIVHDGKGFAEILSPDESRHLYQDRRDPNGWPVWGVYWKLPPWP